LPGDLRDLRFIGDDINRLATAPGDAFGDFFERLFFKRDENEFRARFGRWWRSC